MSKPYLLTTLCLILSTGATAQSQDTDIRPLANQLSGEQIESVFSDIKMDGAYNFGRDGLAQSFYTEIHKPDGTVTYEERGDVSPGRWFVRRDSLCFTYPSDRLSGGCFRVYQVANCYYFYDATTMRSDYELGEDYWIARAVKAGEVPACEAAIS